MSYLGTISKFWRCFRAMITLASLKVNLAVGIQGSLVELKFLGPLKIHSKHVLSFPFKTDPLQRELN